MTSTERPGHATIAGVVPAHWNSRRALQIAGAVLILAGLFMIVRPPSYSREESVFKLGEFEAKVQQERSIPGWVGGIVLGAGLVLVVLGFKKR